MPRLTTEELAHRREGMGATDVVEACGLAPWEGAGPMRLWNEKVGIVTPDDADVARNDDRADHLEWGHVLEPVILEWYASHHGVSVLPGGQVRHPIEPWLWASLDASVVGASRIVEIKAVSAPSLYRHWDVSSQDGVPPYVRAQVTIGMACHGAREADVVASVGGRPPHTWTVAYDEELATLLIDGARRFWALVQDGTPPPLDATPATRDYLLHRYPANTERSIIECDDEDVCAIMAGRIDAARVRAEADTQVRTLDAQLMQRVGEHDGIRTSAGSFTWKLDKNARRATRFTAARDD